MSRTSSAWLIACVLATGAASHAGAADAQFRIGPLVLTAPEGWQRKEPASRIIQDEFAIAPAEGDTLPGRMTVTAAGGSVEANLERWYGQFTQPDGSKTADRAKVEKLEVSGVETHLVDIAGNYLDRPSPREPGVVREKYRLLGAILVTGDGTFYVKFYGPEKTIAAQEKAFKKMIAEAKKS